MILRFILMLSLAGGATAGTIDPGAAGPPEPVGPGEVQVHALPQGASSSCPLIYDNTQNYVGSYYSQQLGEESMDDLHMFAGGALCAFTLGYNEPASALVNLTVHIYANNPGDSPPGPLVGGPWTITNLPPGANSVTLTLDTQPLLPENVWFGVQFSSSTAGLLISDPPALGVSHDYFYETAAGYLSFGGSPRANFLIGLQMELAVPVETTTWGSLKARYE